MKRRFKRYIERTAVVGVKMRTETCREVSEDLRPWVVGAANILDDAEDDLSDVGAVAVHN